MPINELIIKNDFLFTILCICAGKKQNRLAEYKLTFAE